MEENKKDSNKIVQENTENAAKVDSINNDGEEDKESVKEEIKDEKKQEPTLNILENGAYQIRGPENGDIQFDTIELRSQSGARRIWKVKEFSPKEIILEVIRFG